MLFVDQPAGTGTASHCSVLFVVLFVRLPPPPLLSL